MSTEIANILERAAELIETKGWTQGSYVRYGNGEEVGDTDYDAECFCISGALSHASKKKDFDMMCKAYYFLTDIICKTRNSTKCLEKWNDDPARTKEEVIAFLKSAAELARKEAANV